MAIMNEGRIEQSGTPAEIYEAPVSSFVAAFIGDTNFFDSEIISSDGEYCLLKTDGFPDITVYNDKNIKAGTRVHLSIRPEKFIISSAEPVPREKFNVLKGIVEEIIYMGAHTIYWIKSGGSMIQVRRLHDRYQLDEKPISWGDTVRISWHADNCFMLERYRTDDKALLTLPDESMAGPGDTEAGEP
jgi:spermidine/putrescine transport system ATP-binding protein